MISLPAWLPVPLPLPQPSRNTIHRNRAAVTISSIPPPPRQQQQQQPRRERGRPPGRARRQARAPPPYDDYNLVNEITTAAARAIERIVRSRRARNSMDLAGFTANEVTAHYQRILNQTGAAMMQLDYDDDDNNDGQKPLRSRRTKLLNLIDSNSDSENI